METDMKISMLKSTLKSVIDEISTLKNEYVELKSEYVSSRKVLVSPRNSLRASRDNLNMVQKELLKNECRMLLAKKAYMMLREKHVYLKINIC